MKKINTAYWIITGLFAAFMAFSAVPDVVSEPDAVKMVSGGLGYPAYIIPFLGVAKLVGVIAILMPGFPRVKEWAYAGLFFDLAGAAYSGVAAAGNFEPQILFMILPVGFLFLSYYLWHRKYVMADKVNR